MSIQNTKRKTFITFKKEDASIKDEIVEFLEEKNCIIDKQYHQDDWIKIYGTRKKLRQYIIENHIKDSSVTLFLLTKNSIIKDGKHNHLFWIKVELEASLSARGDNNTRNGILMVVDDSIFEKIIVWNGFCNGTNEIIEWVKKEYLLPHIHKNIFMENENYCHCKKDNHISNKNQYVEYVSLSDFKKDPKKYLDIAFEKSRNKELLDKVRVSFKNEDYT